MTEICLLKTQNTASTSTEDLSFVLPIDEPSLPTESFLNIIDHIVF